MTVVQAKSRYHSALRSLEGLSNQAHLRRGSSGVLENQARSKAGLEAGLEAACQERGRHHERRKNDSRSRFRAEVGSRGRSLES